MNGLKIFSAFVVGSLIGGLVTYKYQENKYADKYTKDIKELKEYYESLSKKEVPKQKKEDISMESPEQEVEEPQEDVNKFKNECESDDYTKYSSTVHNNDEDLEPYVIKPEEFGEIEDYETVTLRKYADGYVADEELQTVDIDETIGYDSLNHFGEYEEDSVYVRNDKLMTDFEILLDARKFQKVYGGYDD